MTSHTTLIILLYLYCFNLINEITVYRLQRKTIDINWPIYKSKLYLISEITLRGILKCTFCTIKLGLNYK